VHRPNLPAVFSNFLRVSKCGVHHQLASKYIFDLGEFGFDSSIHLFKRYINHLFLKKLDISL